MKTAEAVALAKRRIEAARALGAVENSVHMRTHHAQTVAMLEALIKIAERKH